MKANHILLLFAMFMIFSCSSKEPGTDFIGTWIMRDTNAELTIAKSDVYFAVSGATAFSGNYVLNQSGTLISGDGRAVNIQYYEKADIIVATDNRSIAFDRKK